MPLNMISLKAYEEDPNYILQEHLGLRVESVSQEYVDLAGENDLKISIALTPSVESGTTTQHEEQSRLKLLAAEANFFGFMEYLDSNLPVDFEMYYFGPDEDEDEIVLKTLRDHGFIRTTNERHKIIESMWIFLTDILKGELVVRSWRIDDLLNMIDLVEAVKIQEDENLERNLGNLRRKTKSRSEMVKSFKLRVRPDVIRSVRKPVVRDPLLILPPPPQPLEQKWTGEQVGHGFNDECGICMEPNVPLLEGAPIASNLTIPIGCHGHIMHTSCFHSTILTAKHRRTPECPFDRKTFDGVHTYTITPNTTIEEFQLMLEANS